jgi:hypothetical protein
MFLKSSLVALALAGTAFIGSNTAEARSAITIGFGNVAIGYRDGYVDNNHNYHRWQHRADYVSYRGQHGSQYHDWNHDRAR